MPFVGGGGGGKMQEGARASFPAHPAQLSAVSYDSYGGGGCLSNCFPFSTLLWWKYSPAEQ